MSAPELRADLQRIVRYVKRATSPDVEAADLLECWLRTYAADQLRGAASRMFDRGDARALELLADELESHIGADIRALERAVLQEEETP